MKLKEKSGDGFLGESSQATSAGCPRCSRQRLRSFKAKVATSFLRIFNPSYERVLRWLLAGLWACGHQHRGNANAAYAGCRGSHAR